MLFLLCSGVRASISIFNINNNCHFHQNLFSFTQKIRIEHLHLFPVDQSKRPSLSASSFSKRRVVSFFLKLLPPFSFISYLIDFFFHSVRMLFPQISLHYPSSEILSRESISFLFNDLLTGYLLILSLIESLLSPRRYNSFTTEE